MPQMHDPNMALFIPHIAMFSNTRQLIHNDDEYSLAGTSRRPAMGSPGRSPPPS